MDRKEIDVNRFEGALNNVNMAWKKERPSISGLPSSPVVRGRSKKFRLAYFAVLCEVHEAEEALDLVGDLHLSLLVALHLVKAEKVEGLQHGCGQSQLHPY